MTKQEYAEYQERVENYLHGLTAVSTGPCPGCPDCEDYRQHKTEDAAEDAAEDEYLAEPFFTWHSCEVCGDSQGGNREPWHGVADGEIVHGDCCEDCVYYLNYGRLDDASMAEIESSADAPEGA